MNLDKIFMANTQLQVTMRDQTTQQMEVRHQGHISRNKRRVSVGESTNGTQQVMSDIGKKMLPHTNRVTPLPRTGTMKRKVGYRTSTCNGRRKDNEQTVMVTHIKTDKKDRKDHLYKQTMIARMILQ
jgi:hypothetical protein